MVGLGVRRLEQAPQVQRQPGDGGLRDAPTARTAGVAAARVSHAGPAYRRLFTMLTSRRTGGGRRSAQELAEDLAGRRPAGARRRTSPSAGTCSGPGAPRSSAMTSSSSTRAPVGHHDVGLHRLARVRVGHADDRDLRRRRGARASTSSTSAGYTLKPDTMIRSLARSTRKRKPVVVDHGDVAGAQPAVGGERRGRWPRGRSSSRRTRWGPAPRSRRRRRRATSSPSASTSRTSTPGSGTPMRARPARRGRCAEVTTGDASVRP